MISISVPWNSHTLSGYAVSMLYDVGGGILFAFSHSCFVILFILTFLHHQAFYKMFRQFVLRIDQSNGNKNRRKFFRQLIDFHIMAEE